MGVGRDAVDADVLCPSRSPSRIVKWNDDHDGGLDVASSGLFACAARGRDERQSEGRHDCARRGIGTHDHPSACAPADK